jgi:hypothetical protein
MECPAEYGLWDWHQRCPHEQLTHGSVSALLLCKPARNGCDVLGSHRAAELGKAHWLSI